MESIYLNTIKKGFDIGSVTDGREILWCSAPLRKIYSALRLGDNPKGRK